MNLSRTDEDSNAKPERGVSKLICLKRLTQNSHVVCLGSHTFFSAVCSAAIVIFYLNLGVNNPFKQSSRKEFGQLSPLKKWGKLAGS